MSQNGIPRAAVLGTASGVLFMAFFGTAWAGIGIGGLQGWAEIWLLIPALVIGAALFVCGITLITASKGLPAKLQGADARQSKRMGMWFGIIFGLEGALIGAAGAICSAADHFDLFFPIMALIVGVHFFPLASLFRVKSHYITGALLCLLAAFTLLFVPARVTWGQHPIVAWWSVLGFGSALILWANGIAVWLMGRRLLNKARNEIRRSEIA